jgi:hypothetical protein
MRDASADPDVFYRPPDFQFGEATGGIYHRNFVKVKI